jgi:hypothetical protein
LCIEVAEVRWYFSVVWSVREKLNAEICLSILDRSFLGCNRHIQGSRLPLEGKFRVEYGEAICCDLSQGQLKWF